MRCSTCKPTLTALPGDSIMGILAAISSAGICFFFYALKKYLSPVFTERTTMQAE